MTFFKKATIAGILIGIFLYCSSLFILPSVTLVNNSGEFIENAKINLPNSSLDFGSLNSGEKNTLHYSLKQKDGTYKYNFIISPNVLVTGECGYVTSNEINKHAVIFINKNDVKCE